MHRRLATVLVGGLLAGFSLQQPRTQNQASPQPYAPVIADASNEPYLAMKRIQIPAGLRVDLFAAEPLLANPVAFCIDERGRFYVAETFRLHAGVTDIRNHMNWLDDDLACRTVEDRVAMLKRRLGKDADTYAVEHDRVRLIEDTDGDGKADRASVYADGFHHIADGIGAGVIARQGKVWYTCIPDLWLLGDTTGKRMAHVRRSLQHGFGVHVGFLGHDLHGLRFGPDGKLYFSIGDRGTHVETAGRTVSLPDAGAVFRCNPDGSEFEIFATGLRNPQELAFDEYGNLFTCDNNADGGDKARCVYVVEGGDSGWRIGYQFLTSPVVLGTWNAEKLWQPEPAKDAAYLVPPLANIADGPSGLTYHPGVASLPEEYQRHFFLCDFRGGSGNSGVRSFALKSKGASFELVDARQFAWSILATDVDFGPDGGLYVLDWVEGWNKPNKGRIYKVHDPQRDQDASILQVKTLLAEGTSYRSLEELARHLEHPDMRVRQEAQLALAERGSASIPTLALVVGNAKTALARIHALWALGQIARKESAALPIIESQLTCSDPEVRAQAAKLVGESRATQGLPKLLELTRDESPRVRFFAAMSLGKLGRDEATSALLQLLRDNADKDAYLRHAAVMGLVGIRDTTALQSAAKDASPSVRMGALLAMRRLRMPNVAAFLTDPDPRLVLEAARAINDEPIPEAFGQLAALVTRPGLSERVMYRVLNANFRLGKPEQARAVAAYVGRGDSPEPLRIEGIAGLAEWETPSGRDRIVGVWRPLEPRPVAVAAEAVRPIISDLLRSAPDQVRAAAAQLAGRLAIKEATAALRGLVADTGRSGKARTAALKALDQLVDPDLTVAVRKCIADKDAMLRAEARRLFARLQPAEAVPVLQSALEQGSVAEQQSAFSILGEMGEPSADAVLSRWLDKLLAGQVPALVQLDLLQAAERRSADGIKEKLARHEAARPKDDPVARYREALAGGNAERGRHIFYEKAEVSCLRCHKIRGEGGDVGPDLTKVGEQQKREYLLESIVDPNRQIAKGFETVVLALTNGQVQTGIIKSENDKNLTIITAEGKLVVIPKSDIEERTSGKSAMPEDILKFLTKSELRDLVEFLATLK